MQCTTPPPGTFVVSCDGLPSDEDMAALVAAAGPLLAVRLLVSTSGSGCGCEDHGPRLVALDPADPTVPPCERTAATAVRSGVGVADAGSAHLMGGTVALAGLDVVISDVANLIDGALAGVVLVSLGDLTASLARTAERHSPHLRTLAILDSSASSPPPGTGWTHERTADRWVPVATGLAAAEHACRSAVPA